MSHPNDIIILATNIADILRNDACKNNNQKSNDKSCCECKTCPSTKSAKTLSHEEKVARRMKRYPIKDVKIFNQKSGRTATVVYWKDNTKTVSVCRPGETYNPWTGLSIAICKKLMGMQAFHDVFETYIPKECQPERRKSKK